MSSTEIAKNLDSARTELQAKQTALLEKKEDFVRIVETILPEFVDRSISRVISQNADHVEQMSPEDLRKMKNELAGEKPRAIDRGLSALRSASDWLLCPSSGTIAEPVGWSGLNNEGSIWKSFQNFSKTLEDIFKKYGFTLEYMYSLSPFRFSIPRSEREGPLQQLETTNKEIGASHREYCDAKSKVNYLEGQLKEAKAREKFESV